LEEYDRVIQLFGGIYLGRDTLKFNDKPTLESYATALHHHEQQNALGIMLGKSIPFDPLLYLQHNKTLSNTVQYETSEYDRPKASKALRNLNIKISVSNADGSENQSALLAKSECTKGETYGRTQSSHNENLRQRLNTISLESLRHFQSKRYSSIEQDRKSYDKKNMTSSTSAHLHEVCPKPSSFSAYRSVLFSTDIEKPNKRSTSAGSNKEFLKRCSQRSSSVTLAGKSHFTESDGGLIKADFLNIKTGDKISRRLAAVSVYDQNRYMKTVPLMPSLSECNIAKSVLDDVKAPPNAGKLGQQVAKFQQSLPRLPSHQ